MDTLLNPETLLSLLAALAVLGVLLFVWGLRRLWHRRIVSGSSEILGGVVLVVVGLAAGAVAANLYTYHRFTAEHPVAEVLFAQIGEQAFDTRLTLADGADRQLELHGDEWQLDARVLKWEGLAILGGAEPRFRLERLSGRYQNLQQARSGPYTVYDLHTNPGVDLWSLAQRYPDRLPWVDAVYGSGVYMPMADAARYEITIAPSGLVVRPLNKAARQAAAGWQ